MSLDLEIGQQTDVGRRRDHNEDCLGIYQPEDESRLLERGIMLVVADGMGGYAAGEIASRTAVEAVAETYFGEETGGTSEALARSMRQANTAVLAEASREADRAGMGTTMAVAIVLGDELFVANVGDSRVYILHDKDLDQVTHDHSWVAELIAVGKITPEEARRHPMRNVVTRSLGGRAQVEVETYAPRPLQDGDVILLCSDGLWGMVPGDTIRDIIATRPAQAAADALIRAANEAGGHDNITAIVCRIGRTAVWEDAEKTEQLDPAQLQDTQPMPRLDP